MKAKKRDGCKRLFVHARWRPLRLAETKRRNRNGEQEEKSRHEKIFADEKNYTVAEEEDGQEDSEEGSQKDSQKDSQEEGGRQGIQAGFEEKDRQESGWQTCEEGCTQGQPTERTRKEIRGRRGCGSTQVRGDETSYAHGAGRG